MPDQADTGRFRRILDVGSGSGSWAIETAQAHPEMAVFGIDISQRMVHHAREQAAIYGVGDRVEFHVAEQGYGSRYHKSLWGVGLVLRQHVKPFRRAVEDRALAALCQTQD